MNTHPLEVIELLIEVELRKRSYTEDEFRRLFMGKLQVALNEALWNSFQFDDIHWSKDNMKEWMRLYQKNLLGLMDTVAGQLSEKEALHQFDLTDRYKAVFTCLKNHLIYMMDVAGRQYVDIDCLVPSFYFDIDEDKLKSDLRLIRDKLIDTGMDGEYWSILRQAFNCLFSSDGSSRISYRQFFYLDELYKELIKLLPVENDVFPKKLKYVLINMNFNDDRYFSYVIGVIKKEVNELSGTKEKLLKLFDWDQSFFMASERINVSYKPSQPFLKQQLTLWIKERMEEIEQQPRKLELSDLDPGTAMVIGLAEKMQMSQRQLNQFLELIIQEEFYKREKETIDQLFTLFPVTVPEDNPAAEEIINALRVAVKLKKLKSRLWF
jgi:hypothetical protein